MSTRRVTWNAEVAVDLAREQLAADRVADVVGHERDVGEAELPRARLHHVGLREQRVRASGFSENP